MDKESNAVVKAGIGYTIGNYLIKGLSFFSIPLFTRLMSTDDYGRYNIFLAYEGICFILIGLALHSSYKKAKYVFKAKYQDYVVSTFCFIIVNAFVFFMIVAAFGDSIGEVLGLGKKSLMVLVLFSFSTAIVTCYNSLISIDYKYKRFILIALINALGNLGLSILLMYTILCKNRYLARVLGTAIPTFVISIYIICKVINRKLPSKFLHNIKWGLSYSLPIVPHGISQIFLNQFDRIMINNLIGASAAGIYSFAYNIYSIINITTNSLSNAWEPWFFKKMHEHAYGEIKRKSTYYIWFMFIFTILIMLISPEIVIVLGTEVYYEAVYLVIPIVAGGYFVFLYTFPAGVEYYYEKTKYIAMGTALAALLNVILNYVFINRYGFIAAAYTTLVSYIIYFIFHYFLASKIEKEKIFDIKIIIASCVLIMLTNGVCLLLIPLWYIRWGLALGIGCVALLIEEKKIGVIKRFIVKK